MFPWNYCIGNVLDWIELSALDITLQSSFKRIIIIFKFQLFGIRCNPFDLEMKTEGLGWLLFTVVSYSVQHQDYVNLCVILGRVKAQTVPTTIEDKFKALHFRFPVVELVMMIARQFLLLFFVDVQGFQSPLWLRPCEYAVDDWRT